ncbi:unnamed protein product, partial [Amoebophrya sp. A120]|eukprot:GSA120T00013689001.1
MEVDKSAALLAGGGGEGATATTGPGEQQSASRHDDDQGGRTSREGEHCTDEVLLQNEQQVDSTKNAKAADEDQDRPRVENLPTAPAPAAREQENC